MDTVYVMLWALSVVPPLSPELNSCQSIRLRADEQEEHTVGFMVPRSNHVRLRRGNRGHLIIILVEQRLIDLGAVCDGGVRKEALDFLLQPVVRIGDIAGWQSYPLAASYARGASRLTVPQEFGILALLLQRLDGVVVVRSQGVCSTLANVSGQTVRADETQINHHSDRVRGAISSRTTRPERVRGRGVAVLRQVVVQGIGLQTGDFDVIVVGRRGRVRDGDVGRCRMRQRPRCTSIADRRPLQLGVCVPADNHAGWTGIRQTQLHGRRPIVRSIGGVGEESGSRQAGRNEGGKVPHLDQEL